MPHSGAAVATWSSCACYAIRPYTSAYQQYPPGLIQRAGSTFAIHMKLDANARRVSNGVYLGLCPATVHANEQTVDVSEFLSTVNANNDE